MSSIFLGYGVFKRVFVACTIFLISESIWLISRRFPLHFHSIGSCVCVYSLFVIQHLIFGLVKLNTFSSLSPFLFRLFHRARPPLFVRPVTRRNSRRASCVLNTWPAIHMYIGIFYRHMDRKKAEKEKEKEWIIWTLLNRRACIADGAYVYQRIACVRPCKALTVSVLSIFTSSGSCRGESQCSCVRKIHKTIP